MTQKEEIIVTVCYGKRVNSYMDRHEGRRECTYSILRERLKEVFLKKISASVLLLWP